jgi:hypothetical protein
MHANRAAQQKTNTREHPSSAVRGCRRATEPIRHHTRYSTAAVPDTLQGCGAVVIGGAWEARIIEENSRAR